MSSLFLIFTLLFSIPTATLSQTQTLDISTPELHNPKLPPHLLSTSKRFEGSSNLVDLKYHMGPVLSSSPINVYIVWYGKWDPNSQHIIKDFLLSISPPTGSTTTHIQGRKGAAGGGHHHHRKAAVPSAAKLPTVSDWWKTVSLFTDQTGANVSRNLVIAGEYSDRNHSQGQHLTRLSVQQVISNAVHKAPFPIDHKNGIYLILTSTEVTMQDFCRAVCGFHYFTFPSQVGYTLPYAWVGNSGHQCPEVCAYPFAIPGYMGGGGSGGGGTGLSALKSPNGEIGVDGMISVIGHELAELSTNPLINAWYAGEDPTAPTEIGDLCEGLYGTGGGGGYIGEVMKGRSGESFNLYGVMGRRFLVQWVWSPVLKACSGPNAMD